MRALLLATESRAVAATTIRKWQCFLNSVVRGATRQRLSKMQQDQVTQRDLTLRLGLKQVSTYVGESQLRYIGEVSPENQSEACVEPPSLGLFPPYGSSLQLSSGRGWCSGPILVGDRV